METRGMSREHVGLFREESKDRETTSRPRSNEPHPKRRDTTSFKNLVKGRKKDDKGNATWDAISFSMTGGFYFIGALCLLIYSFYIMHHSPTLGPMHTVIPVVLHLVGTGATVAIKVYFDWRKDIVGHLESM